ncbi:NAD-dependent epimerase/dehydratase family protein [Nocardia sp. NPDC058518]|uniref:NAD-dependent epimerase/dehydratase family protein n=1 Tax=Nocardia sp. NPDC058518 TaxID=3346534 RepID=UPI003650D4C1
MSEYLVIGSGPVGRAVTSILVEQGHTVTIATRSGSGPDLPGITLAAADASVREQIEPLARRAEAIFCAVHGSKYSARVWRAELPPIEAALLNIAADRSIPIVFPESMYAFGAPDGPMTETSPQTATSGKSLIRVELLRNREAHAAQTISVAASDFFGPHATTSHVGSLVVPKVLAGKSVLALGDVDQPHSFTYVPDLARAMVTAAAQAQTLTESNRFLFAPTGPPLTMAEMTARVADVAGVAKVTARAIPAWLVRAGGVLVPDMREMADVLHQWTQPYVVDSSRSEEELQLKPTPLDDALAVTVDWARNA